MKIMTNDQKTIFEQRAARIIKIPTYSRTSKKGKKHSVTKHPRHLSSRMVMARTVILPEKHPEKTGKRNLEFRLRSRYTPDHNNNYTIYENGRAIGFFDLNIDRETKIGSLSGVDIDEGYHGRGYGRKVVEFIEGESARQGMKRLDLYHVSNTEFFGYMGYKPIKGLGRRMSKEITKEDGEREIVNIEPRKEVMVTRAEFDKQQVIRQKELAASWVGFKEEYPEAYEGAKRQIMHDSRTLTQEELDKEWDIYQGKYSKNYRSTRGK